MTDKQIKSPGPDHPITIAPQPGRVTVRVGEQLIADTTAALALREGSYPAVLYIPRADVDMALLERSEHHSYCPYKGEASHYSVPAIGAKAANAVWTYEHAYEAVAAIEGHLAFYPDRVTITA